MADSIRSSARLAVEAAAPILLAAQEARLISQAGLIDLMRPVVEYVSLGRGHMDFTPYPDATARRALGALDDLILSSPQARELIANVKPPIGPGKPDDPAELQRRMDAAVPGAITELRAAVAERDATIAGLRAELDEMRDTAANRFVEELTNQTKLRSIDFRNGMHMDLEPAREIVAAFVACARTMLGDAPNYTETKVEMDVKVAESPETFTFVVQRREPGCLTPHEARVAAEDKAAQLQTRLEEASAVIVLASQQVSLDSHAWVTLDGYDGSGDDGSGDACRELETKGYTRSGNGGWYPPVEPVVYPACLAECGCQVWRQQCIHPNKPNHNHAHWGLCTPGRWDEPLPLPITTPAVPETQEPTS
jgi:hypothetical protein